MAHGFFITFEGLDGTGKTTQLRLLAEELEAQGHAVTRTRQPGGTVLGDRIRGLLLDSRSSRIAPMAELALMFADRAESIHRVILPALERGEIVLCDRFTDSTEAYQGGGRELGSGVVLELEAILCQSLKPDLTILLAANAEASLQRARRRNLRAARGLQPDENRFETEDAAFHQRVEQKYREIAERERERVAVVASDGTIEEIHAKVAGIVRERLHGPAEPRQREKRGNSDPAGRRSTR